MIKIVLYSQLMLIMKKYFLIKKIINYLFNLLIIVISKLNN